MEELDHLRHERSAAQFDVDAMKVVWAGSKHALEVTDRMSRLVASDPEFRKDNRASLGRKELFRNTLRKAAHAWKHINELHLTEEEASMLRFFMDEPAYVDLHWVARFLVKTVSQLGSGKPPVGTISYMWKIEHLMQYRCNVERAEDWLNPAVVLEAFESRAVRMTVCCAKNISKAKTPEEGFSELSADLMEAAVAHCQLIIVSKFIAKVQQQQDIEGRGVGEQLRILCSIYALSLLHKHQGDFLSTGCITPNQGVVANEQLRSLYTQIRPNAIALVDAFNYTDHYLGSVLGPYDGNVYPNLYDEAWKDPLNDPRGVP